MDPEETESVQSEEQNAADVSGSLEVPLEVEVDAPVDAKTTDEEQKPEASGNEQEQLEQQALKQAQSEADRIKAQNSGKGEEAGQKSRSAERIQELLTERTELRNQVAESQRMAEQRYTQIVSGMQQQNSALQQQVNQLMEKLSSVVSSQQRAQEEALMTPQQLADKRAEEAFRNSLKNGMVDPAMKQVLDKVTALEAQLQEKEAYAAQTARFQSTMQQTEQIAGQVVLSSLKPELLTPEFKEATKDFILTFGAAGAAHGRKVDLASAAKDFNTYLDQYYNARLRSSVKAPVGPAKKSDGQTSQNKAPGSQARTAQRTAPVSGGKRVTVSNEPPKGAGISELLTHFMKQQPSDGD